MRILVISSFYPPNYIGGYEIMCKEAVEELKKRGHTVCVLTSNYGRLLNEDNPWVYRLLHTTFSKEFSGFKKTISLLRREVVNRKIVRQVIRSFKPDIIYIWHISHISISLAHEAQASGIPVSYYISDHWMLDWTCDPFRGFWLYPSKNKFRAYIKKMLKWVITSIGLLPSQKLDLQHAQFSSRYLYQLPVHDRAINKKSEVIHWGIDVNKFPFKKNKDNPRRILYAGQIIDHKGLMTAVKAIQTIIDNHRRDIMLSIVGDHVAHEYGRDIYATVTSSKYMHYIQFKGFIPYEKISEIYQEHDILVFPSLWDEPFGNIILEAMASGVAVIATGTGGSSEILRDEKNCLLFSPGDATACARHILRLVGDPLFYERIRYEGRCTVEERFRFEKTMDSIERSLLNVYNQKNKNIEVNYPT